MTRYLALTWLLLACGNSKTNGPAASSAGGSGTTAGSSSSAASSLAPELGWLVGTYDLPVAWKQASCPVGLQGDKLAYKIGAAGDQLALTGLMTSHGELRATIQPVAGGFKASGSVPLESGKDLPPDEQNEVFTLAVVQDVAIDGAKVTGTVRLEVRNPGGQVGCVEEGTISGTRTPPTPPPPPSTTAVGDAGTGSAPLAPGGAPHLDCTQLVTAEDIKKLCGTTVAVEPQTPSKFRACQVLLRGGSGADELRGLFTVYRPANAAELESELSRAKPEGSQPLAGVGTEAWTFKRSSSLSGDRFLVGARKGDWLTVFDAAKAFASPPCTLDQMVDVTKVAVPRLP